MKASRFFALFFIFQVFLLQNELYASGGNTPFMKIPGFRELHGNLHSTEGKFMTTINSGFDNDILKSGDVKKIKLDSITCRGADENFKYYYIYDNKGNNTTLISYTWNSTTSVWMQSWKQELTFDANNKIASLIFYRYDSSNNLWNIDDGNHSKTEIMSDPYGKRVSLIDYSYDSQTKLWEERYKTEYAYNQSGLKILETHYRWNQQWNIQYKTEYSYNQDGILITETEYFYKENQYILDRKYEYTYAPNGIYPNSIEYLWVSNSWMPTWKDEFIYDANGHLISYMNSSYNYTTEIWKGTSSFNITYDTIWNFTEMIAKRWNRESNEWEDYTKNIVIYDYSYFINEIIFPNLDDSWEFHLMPDEIRTVFSISTNKVNSFSNYSFKNGAFDLDEIYSLYYSGITTDIADRPKSEVLIYPNPAKDYIEIHCDKTDGFNYFELINSQGEEVLNLKYEVNMRIPVNNFPKGMYFYRIVDKNEIHSGKLVIQ